MKRRRFLGLAALAPLTCAGVRRPRRPRTAPAAPLALDTPLRVPPLLHPEPADGGRSFELTLQEGLTEILPGTRTPTWGINGTFLGPTLRAARGDEVRMTVRNRLPEITTVHWHGMRLPALIDGGPHQVIESGADWAPRWTLDQPAATTWYHPHPHGSTARHMYRGLAGMFVIDDAQGPELPSAYGVDDFPLLLQDKSFAADGSLAGDPLQGTYGILGDHHLVNGTYDPRLDVTTERVRLRLLNAANARMYNLAFADQRRFHVIANDGGLLAAPVEVGTLTLTPGERAEIVVPFAPGEEAILQTVDNGVDIAAGTADVLRFVAAPELGPSPALPAQLADPTPIVPPQGARVRRFELNGRNAINGNRMDMQRIDEIVPAGAVEIWEIINPGNLSHNFHIHEVAFQILDVNGAPPPPQTAGYKDTVSLPAGASVRLAVRFDGYVDPLSPYMYHCHILRHEDAGMMGQFVIAEPGTENRVRRLLSRNGFTS